MSGYDFIAGQQQARFGSALREMRATNAAHEWESYAHQLEAQMQSLRMQIATAQGRTKVGANLQQEASDLRTELQALGARHLHMMEHFREALDGIEAQFAQEREQHARDLEDVKEDRDWCASCVNDFRNGIIP